MTRLSKLQRDVLVALAGIEPEWTLTGGGALVGFHLGHRTTRDLDLFWHGQSSISDARREVLSRLRASGFEVSEIRSQDSFSTLRVQRDESAVVIDLVAEPVPAIESPHRTNHRGVGILVDTPHEILVNKLCALLHRSELRDLIDIQALLSAGGNLDQALSDAPRKDGGFSALTLGWTLQGWDLEAAAEGAGLETRAKELTLFRDKLLARVAKP